MMASSSSKKISVKCSDGMVLEVDETLVNASPTMKCLVEEKCGESNIVITLPNISSKILSKIIEFLKVDLESDATFNDVGVQSVDVDSKAPESLTSFNNLKLEFIKFDANTLLYLVTATHYLKIEKIYHLGCVEAVRRIRENAAK
ncbi:SKP1-like protein 1B [Cajanus cajan]|uniref:SKP1-like protein 1B n=1 Tax=Cajanus cajan TaxID=3821 RepID=UPI00098DC6F0|nr:SKP1-like protein 1B [Cajanus cajan]